LRALAFRASKQAYTLAIHTYKHAHTQVDLEPNQVLRADTGSLIYMTEGVELETTLGGGLSAGAKRYMTGQSAFITDYRYTGEGGHGTVCLGTEYPSRIMRLALGR
jgi:uncharacterized protein (AIM24 family)